MDMLKITVGVCIFLIGVWMGFLPFSHTIYDFLIMILWIFFMIIGIILIYKGLKNEIKPYLKRVHDVMTKQRT